MIALFTDFGIGSPYVGQVHAVLETLATGVARIDLCHDLTPFEPKGAAYLLNAFALSFEAETVFICVVDPGVGGARLPLIVRVGRHWFVGPENGLIEILARHAVAANSPVIGWMIKWRPDAEISATFHGRDLFAPIAAKLAMGWRPDNEPDIATPLLADEYRYPDWPDNFAEIIYIDRYGNGMTGIHASAIPEGAQLICNGEVLTKARTFSDRRPGELFWFKNAHGLVEIAAFRARACDQLGLTPGTGIEIRL